MQKEKKDKHFVKKPVYEGGPKALKSFIQSQLQYPDEAAEKKIEGTVVLTYTIDHQGRVTETRVISGPGHGCEEEAERVVRLLKFKVPKTRGVKVTFHKNIQIHFRLPKTKREKKQATSYRYTLVPKPSDASQQQDKKKKGGYLITITY